MKKTGVTIFAIFILAVFAGSIFYFINTIRTDYKDGLTRSEKTFKKISDLAENSPENVNETLFSNEEGLLSGKFSKNNETIVAYPNDETSSNVSSSTLVKIFNKTIVKENDTYELKIAVYLLRPSTIYKSARNSFIVILVGTLITIVALIIISVKDGKNKTEQENETDENSDDIVFTEDEKDNEESDENLEDSENKDNSEKDDDFISFENLDKQNFSGFDKKSEENEEDKITFEDDTFSENTNESANSDNDESEKNSEIVNNDFSSDSNNEENNSDVYYNEHKLMSSVDSEQESENSEKSEENKELLKNRIDYEISKSASNESDLSLFLIKVESNSFANIKKYLEDNFGKDNVFNYEKETFALLKENTTVDEAEDDAAKLEQEIKNLFPESKVFVGISSRSTRILGAERLLMEADEALKHTSDDEDSHIIGFHVDIEKYRELLKNS